MIYIFSEHDVFNGEWCTCKKPEFRTQFQDSLRNNYPINECFHTFRGKASCWHWQVGSCMTFKEDGSFTLVRHLDQPKLSGHFWKLFPYLLGLRSCDVSISQYDHSIIRKETLLTKHPSLSTFKHVKHDQDTSSKGDNPHNNDTTFHWVMRLSKDAIIPNEYCQYSTGCFFPRSQTEWIFNNPHSKTQFFRIPLWPQPRKYPAWRSLHRCNPSLHARHFDKDVKGWCSFDKTYMVNIYSDGV